MFKLSLKAKLIGIGAVIVFIFFIMNQVGAANAQKEAFENAPAAPASVTAPLVVLVK